MAMMSSGQISIANIVKEVLTGDGSEGTTIPNSTQVNIGLSNLKTVNELTHGTGTLTQYYLTWDEPTTNNTAPYAISEFYGGRRDGLGGP